MDRKQPEAVATRAAEDRKEMALSDLAVDDKYSCKLEIDMEMDASDSNKVAQLMTPRDRIDDIVEELFAAHLDWPWLSARPR